MIKDFIKDVIKYLPAQIVPGIVGLISIPIVTRLFSPHDYGNYSLVIATVAILTTLLGWLPVGIIRFYPSYEKDNKINLFYGNIIKLTSISLLVVASIFLVFLFFAKTHLSIKLQLLMYIGLGVFAVNGIFQVFQEFLRAKRQVSWYSGFAIWRSIAGLGFGLGIIVLFDVSIEGLLWGIILCIAVIMPLSWKQTIKRESVLHYKMDRILMKEFAVYGFPLVAGNLAAWILSLSDRFIIEFYRGSLEVGIYSASYNISDRSMTLLVSLFMLASTPILMRIWENEGKAKSREFLYSLTRYYLMICIPLVVGFGVLAKPVISILTDQQYLEGYKIIPYVVASILIFGLQQRFQAGFLFYKKTGFITVAIAASGLLNLILNFLLVPQYGYLAAAVTTLISYVFLLIMMILMSRKLFVWEFPLISLLRIGCVSAVMGVVLYLIIDNSTFSFLINFILCVILGGLIYLILLFLFQEFQPKEKAVIKQILVKFLPSGLIASI